MTHFVKYDLATGAMKGAGEVPDSQVADQAGAGIGVLPLYRACVLTDEGDDGLPRFTFDPLAVVETLSARIDIEAGAARLLFITDVPGQAQTYERKEAEARAWTDASDPADFPFMAAEALLRGVPVDQVRAEIMAAVNRLTPIAASIEAHRMAAKLAVVAASPNVGAMVSAAVIDWAAALA